MATTELAVVERRELARFEPNDEQRRMIRATYANGASDDEFAVLMEIARARNLNPLLRQIHFVKRWTPTGDVWAPQVSIDGLRAIAERTGLYAGQDKAVFAERPDGSIECCEVAVYRKDWPRPVVGVAYWKEYVQTARDKRTGEQKVTAMWVKMPHVMLAKCAESIALRKAFPEDAGGLYTDDEMGQAERVDATVEPDPKPQTDPPAGRPNPLLGPGVGIEGSSHLPPTHPALGGFYARLNEIDLPGESVAVWMKFRADLAPLPVADREAAWRSLCKRTEEAGRMKNAKVWLKKAIAEEDAKRGSITSREPGDDDDDPTPAGGGSTSGGGSTKANGGGASTSVQGGSVSLVVTEEWMGSEESIRAYIAKRCHWNALENAVRKHARVIGPALRAEFLRLAAYRLQMLSEAATGEVIPLDGEHGCKALVRMWAEQGPVSDRARREAIETLTTASRLGTVAA